MFKTYDKKIGEMLLEKNSEYNWDKVLEHHRTMIFRIQHERLIHLLVTIFVGLVMSSAAFITLATKNTYLIIIVILLTGLFVAYLFHYRFLENTTQKWYRLEDEIAARILNY